MKTVKAALVGNPNVGKSTVFNGLTGLRQHTGNWIGKTVACATGVFSLGESVCELTDLPGIYSLRTHSEEEEIARDFICSGQADVLIVIGDATCLERSLHLLKQLSELPLSAGTAFLFCINLCDEAEKKGIVIDFSLLERELGIPVTPCTARDKRQINILKEKIFEVSSETEPGNVNSDSLPSHCPFREDTEKPCAECCGCHGCMLRGVSMESVSPNQRTGQNLCKINDFSPEALAAQAVRYTKPDYRKRQEAIDRFLTGRLTGSLVMILLLLLIFWITITGANYPSSFLWEQFYRLETWMASALSAAGAPKPFTDALVFGVFRSAAWIVSVMLPPMAIFFPLFTLLEDLGYLPRAAFNMDCAFKKCRACGKQCLTMCVVTAPVPQSFAAPSPGLLLIFSDSACIFPPDPRQREIRPHGRRILKLMCFPCLPPYHKQFLLSLSRRHGRHRTRRL